MPVIKKVTGSSSKKNSPIAKNGKPAPASKNAPAAKVTNTPAKNANTPATKNTSPAPAPERKMLVAFKDMSHQRKFITLACFIPAIFGCDQKSATRTYRPDEGHPFSCSDVEKLPGEKNKDVLTIVEDAMKKKFPNAQYRLTAKDSADYSGYVSIVMEFTEPKPVKEETTEKKAPAKKTEAKVVPAKPIKKGEPVVPAKIAKPGAKIVTKPVAPPVKPSAKLGKKS